MDETSEDEDCFLADLKPDGGLKVCGSTKDTCDDLYFSKKVSYCAAVNIHKGLNPYFLLGCWLAAASTSWPFLSLSFADLDSFSSSSSLSLFSLPESDSLPDSELGDSSASRLAFRGGELSAELSSLSDPDDDSRFTGSAGDEPGELSPLSDEEDDLASLSVTAIMWLWCEKSGGRCRKSGSEEKSFRDAKQP